MSSARPVLSYGATLLAGQARGTGQFQTVTVSGLSYWETLVNIGVRYGTGISIATAVAVQASNDGGTTFETEPMYAASIPAVASASRSINLRLPSGVYAITMVLSGPSATFFGFTQQRIDAYSFG